MNTESNTMVNEIETDNAFNMKPLMFETFVCTMALMTFVTLSGPIAREIGMTVWQMGFAVTVAGVTWMLMARFWGALSDRKGRRPIILFGLAGFLVTYAAFVLFVDFAVRSAMAPLLAFAGIVIGRAIAGFFYASVPATSAALVADNVPPKDRAGAMAAIGGASAMGMIFGPGIAALIAPINLMLPLYLTAFLPIIAFIVLWRFLPKLERHVDPDGNAVKLTDSRLTRPISFAFVSAFCVAVAQITVGFFALDRLNLEPSEAARVAGIALAIVGLVLIVAYVMINKLGWHPKKLISIGGVIATVGFGSTIFATAPAMLYVSYAIAAFGMGWIYPSVQALAANSVESHEQGSVAGAVSAAQGLGTVAGPMIGTLLYEINIDFPYLLITVMLLCVAILGKSP